MNRHTGATSSPTPRTDPGITCVLSRAQPRDYHYGAYWRGLQAQVKSSRRRRWRRDAGYTRPRNPSLSTSPISNAVRKRRRGGIEKDRDKERKREREKERERKGDARGWWTLAREKIYKEDRHRHRRRWEKRDYLLRVAAPPWRRGAPFYSPPILPRFIDDQQRSLPPPPPPSPPSPPLRHRYYRCRRQRYPAMPTTKIDASSRRNRYHSARARVALGCFVARFDRRDSDGDWQQPSPDRKKSLCRNLEARDTESILLEEDKYSVESFALVRGNFIHLTGEVHDVLYVSMIKNRRGSMTRINFYKTVYISRALFISFYIINHN